MDFITRRVHHRPAKSITVTTHSMQHECFYGAVPGAWHPLGTHGTDYRSERLYAGFRRSVCSEYSTILLCQIGAKSLSVTLSHLALSLESVVPARGPHVPLPVDRNARRSQKTLVY
jgi:hypothetical protein